MREYTTREILDAIRDIGTGLNRIADSLNKLGLNDANTSMGALEILAKAILDGTETIANSINTLSDTVHNTHRKSHLE